MALSESGRALKAGKSHHSAGWYAGALAFWLLTAWLITVGLSSIIPQIFWPAGDVAPSAAQSCSAELRALQKELLERASERIAFADSGDESAQLSFFERWDERHDRVRKTCREDEQSASRELARVRHGLQGLLERFDNEQAPRLRRLEQLLSTGEHTRAQLSGRTHDE